MLAGHYISAFAAPSGKFTVANDAVVSGPMPLEDAWAAINSDPLILICDK